ncbi:MAG: bifunctional glutamate N-acetyltransferase/amino-acid acetyltransferase ArgJ [Candidatus Dadabacteria bacterium]|nr:bifunctional glutamate N-acetyltransferase/amino-acid acetyltransferase ArgJ [Candidatus Dadabacteria bacterium]MDE0519113.1 bifunctional glutamate N-acetyltransferase/amino-acid acetyltransferase ArgJ [Candidatus Dadabacteria bacterium]MDE0662625.1 bifunctional glutamate N-acetyltransferase/amino-acid acetyltransferase ArgJ [Candidatus Dadabacteria bacterium]
MKNVPGFLLSGVSAGLKREGKRDLALIFSTVPAHASAIFTKNLIKGAPVLVGQERIAGGLCQAIIINSVNANAFTGQKGYEDSLEVANTLSRRLGIDESLVIPSSTGVTGEWLRVGKIKKSIPRLIKGLGEDNVREAAEAIMTTDSFPKYASRQLAVGEKTATVSAIGKGAGMICPDMATMLCFIMTDLDIQRKALSKALVAAASGSFNAITVDGDTSPNDSVFILANGVLGNRQITEKSRDYSRFVDALSSLCGEIAEMIVSDGEGATKVVRINVTEARTERDAEKIARTIASSQLVKTAFYGEDANWGRIVAAAGRAGVKFDPEKIKLYFEGIEVFSKGVRSKPESRFARVFKKPSFTVTLSLGEGKTAYSILTSDLGHKYVSINADYRT